MVIKEFYRTRQDGVNLYRSYSDKGFMVRKAGTDELYEEAIDIENTAYEYEEVKETKESSYDQNRSN